MSSHYSILADQWNRSGQKLGKVRVENEWQNGKKEFSVEEMPQVPE